MSNDELSREVTYTYRSLCGQYTFEKSYDFFDDPPEELFEGDHCFDRIPNQSTKGWVMVEYESENGKKTISEFWRINTSPETFTRDGVKYIKQFGVPQITDPMRLGSGIKEKTPKAFQDILKAAEKRSGIRGGKQIMDEY